MDPNQFASSAALPPSATDPTAAFAPTGDASYADGGTTNPGYDPGLSVPGAAGSPEGQGDGTTSAAPEPDYRQLYEAVNAKAQQYDQILPQYQQYQQAMDELKQMAAQAQAAQQEQAAAERAQSERDQIYQLAQNMPPEQAFTYIRRNEDQILARERAAVQQARQDGQRQTMQVAEQLAAPLYAQEIIKRNGLPDEYTQLIAHLPPRQMDAQLPILKQQFSQQQKMQKQLADALKQIDQFNRSQQAGAIAATGAHTVGANGSSPIALNGQPAKGSDEHLMQLAGRLFG